MNLLNAEIKDKAVTGKPVLERSFAGVVTRPTPLLHATQTQPPAALAHKPTELLYVLQLGRL